MRGKHLLWLSSMCAGLLGAGACSSNHPVTAANAGAGGMAGNDGAGGSATAGAPPVPFQAVGASVYVAKVKSVLLGLAPTDDEVMRVSADPTQLKALIGEWQQQPEYSSKMQRFFELAFQQTQVSETDFADQAYPRRLIINASAAPLVVQNAQQSFARTMLELLAEGHPLTDGMTTQSVMLTTALKEVYAFLDMWEVDDDGKVTDRFKKANPNVSIYAEAAAGPIPIADSLDPTSPNYLHFYDPDVATAGGTVAGCNIDPIVYPSMGETLHHLLFGTLENWKGTGGVTCQQFGGTASAPQLSASDYNDWTLVSIRAPKSGEATTAFWDLPSLRNASELVLSIPRVGFFGTPAFFANWQTNISNQMRVTLNQALIVGLGSSVDGTDTTVPDSTPGLDVTHAGSSDCLFCHRTLDPLRSIFSANYSWNYHNQLDSTLVAQKGLFAFRGVTQPVNSMSDFGAALANHPLFASAWVQKLCYYANSAPCAGDDPEFLRIVNVFQGSNYAWNTLVSELLSSPLVTNATETKTSDTNGEVVAVSRRDHLCAALNNRLGFTDICSLDPQTKKTVVSAIASGLPSDGYGRGSTAPVLPNESTLFYRAGIENICESVATQVIDVAAAKQLPNVKQWVSTSPDAAIADFVSILMALPASDARAAQANALLTAHFNDAQKSGASAANALKSTFIAACMSPGLTSVGL